MTMTMTATMTDPAGESPSRTPGLPSSLRLLALVLEGYAYIALVVATLIGVPALLVVGLLGRRPFVGLIAVLVGVPLLLVAKTAVRALLFRIPAPDGIPVARADAPELHAEVARIRQAIGAPRVDEIMITGHFNASAMQLPRFGVFWPRNYLLIGLPLFAVLSPDQMRAVIAHELAHLSRAHGRLALLVHRLRLSWARLLGALGTGTPTYALFLFRRYAPRLQAHSTALARRHEFVVDRLAARAAGVGPTADTIVALGMVGPLYEELLWSAVERDEGDGPGPFSRAQPDVWPVVAAEGEARLEALLSRTTGPWETHPAAGERLAAIGGTPRIPTAPDRTAGDVWLGTQKARLAARLDEEWAAAEGEAWRRQRDERRESRERLLALERIAAPTPAQLYEKARLVESLDGMPAALPLYEGAAAAGHAGAALAVGRDLLERDDDRGIALVEQAVASDESLGDEGNRRIAEFFAARGRLVEANRYATAARAAATRTALGASERREVSPVDRFGAHGLDQPVLDRIVASLARTPEIRAAFLVRKELRHSAGTQLILAIDANGAPTSLRDRLLAERVIPEEGDSHIVMLWRGDASLRQALEAVRGAAIFRRP
jgi:Zn-dependent protease with chaperone function